jgi:hypothetical protein
MITPLETLQLHSVIVIGLTRVGGAQVSRKPLRLGGGLGGATGLGLDDGEGRWEADGEGEILGTDAAGGAGLR